MKLTVCDVCKHDGTLTETTRYFKIKGKPHMRLDVCEPKHFESTKKLDRQGYKELVAKTKDIPLDIIDKL